MNPNELGVDKPPSHEIPDPLRSAPVANFLLRERRLRSFAEKVEILGIHTVGDFFEYGERNIIRKIRTTPVNKLRIRRLFEKLGL